MRSVLCDVRGVSNGGTRAADVGDLAEAILYYDRVFLRFENPNTFSDVVKWFRASNQLERFTTMIAEGELSIVHCNYHVGAQAVNDVQRGLCLMKSHGNEWDIERFIGQSRLRQSLGSGSVFRRLHRAVVDNARHPESSAIQSSIGEANSDFFRAHRCRAYLASWIEQEYLQRSIKYTPPSLDVRVEPSIEYPDGRRIIWNLDETVADELRHHGIELPSPQSLLSEIGSSTEAVGLAGILKSDLWTSRVVPSFCCDKLRESGELAFQRKNVVDSLGLEVDFPDVRRFVNARLLHASDVFKVRDKSARFREWLSTSNLNEASAIAGYHHEFSTSAGAIPIVKKCLSLAGFLTAVAVTVGVEGAIGSATGAQSGLGGKFVAGVAGQGSKYLFDLANKHWLGWQPVVHGRWLNRHIEASMKE